MWNRLPVQAAVASRVERSSKSKNNVGIVVDLGVTIVTAGTAFELEEADTCVEDQEVELGHLGLEFRCEAFDALTVVHIELHHPNVDLGVTENDILIH